MKIFPFVFMLFFLVSAVYAAPPAPGKKGRIMKCGVSKVSHPNFLKAKGVVKPAGTPAEYKVLVIRVQFQADTNPNTTGNGEFQNTLADVVDFMSQLNSFYTENSYGLITISYTITGEYTLINEMDHYGANDDGYEFLLADAVTAADVDYNFSAFDHYMIYHAGAGEETDLDSVYTDDIWSVYIEGVTGISADSKSITNATFVPEYENYGYDALGVICHEYGHQLGLPDLYMTDGNSESSVGSWSLMDYGLYLDNGLNPAHFDAWSKLQLEVINPTTVVVDNQDFSLYAAESEKSAFVRVPIETADDPAREYLLLEYRLKTAEDFDNYLPASGLLIWHIDDSVGSLTLNNINNDPLHRRVDLIEADKTDASYDRGGALDVFSDGQVFNDSIYPQARAYNGKASGISVVNIAGRGTAALNFKLTRILAAANLDFVKINNYPNPAPGGNTKFVFRATKPPLKIEFDIYNIAGEKVKTVNSNDMLLSSLSANYDWIYEYNWDGYNGSGNKIAPGIYIYRLNMDGEIKTGKIAVIK